MNGSAVLLLLVAAAIPARTDELAFGPETDGVRTSLAAAMAGQTAADERQAAAHMRLGFVPDRARDVLALQQAARDAQAAANRAQSDVGRLLAEASFRAWEVDRLADTWHAPLRRAEEAEKKHPVAVAAAGDAAVRAADAVREADAMEAQAGRDGSKANRQRATAARRTADTLQRDATRRREEAARLQADAERFRVQAIAAWPGLAARCDAVRQLRDGALADAVKVARGAQVAARQAQEAATVALRRLLEEQQAQATNGNDAAAAADSSCMADSSGTSEPSSVAAQDTPAELYATAVATEARLTARYVETRAAELAVIRSVPLATARASVDTPVPARNGVDASALTTAAGSLDSIEEYRGELGRALDEVDAMVTRGHELLAVVGATTDEQTGEVSVAPTAADAGVASELEGLATDDADEPAKDLADLMDAAYAATEAGGSEAAHGAAGGGAASGPGSFLYAPFSPKAAPTGAPSRGGWQVRVNPFDGPETGQPPRPRPTVSPGEYTDSPALFAALPGRRVQADGLPGAEWMHIDSWYLIGPFPNPDRRYLEREFPPEAVIDLDAVYEGADGQPVRWQFLQTGDPVVRVTESYSIYYACAELWFDEPRALWVALGSDDGSRLYLNDLLIWKTVAAKPWRINEAYRRVSFRKGLNRILYRVENGPAHGWFSFLLHVQPPTSEQR